MITTNEYAAFSANVYNGSEIPAGYTLVDQDTRPSGFAAFAYRNNATGEVVVAIRGMQLDQPNDVSTVTEIILNDRVPQQYHDALAFYNAVKDANQGADISLTGHSLGGALASLVAAKTGEEATAFNAVGAKQLLDNPEIGLSLDTDYSATIKNYNRCRRMRPAASLAP